MANAGTDENLTEKSEIEALKARLEALVMSEIESFYGKHRSGYMWAFSLDKQVRGTFAGTVLQFFGFIKK